VLLIIGGVGIAALWVLVFMKPLERIKVLKGFRKKEIEL